MKRFVSPIAIAAVSIGAALAHADDSQHVADKSSDASQKRILITYRNVTAGQAFSPSVFYSHNSAAPPLFAENHPASFHLQRIAEEGNIGPLVSARLTKTRGGAYHHSAIAQSAQPGAERTLSLVVTEEHPLVSGAFMLVMTNDGFSGMQGIDAYALQEPMELELFALDAGTENNNEAGEFLIAMEGTGRDPEAGVVRRHEGLRGDADAPGFWKFDPSLPVAILTIRPEQ